MGLILPRGPSWTHWTTNLAPTSSSTIGTQVPAGSTISYVANTDGDPVTLQSALSHDCEYLIISIAYSGSSVVNSSMLVDILVDAAGGSSWTELIADLFGGFTGSYAGNPASVGREYHFPVWLPAGTSIGARARCAHSALVTPRISLQVGGGNSNPGSWWCGQKVTTVGTFDTANSIGQAHTPGSSGSFSSWTSLGSTLSRAAGAVQWAVQGEMDDTMSSVLYRWQFGMESRQVGPELMHFSAGSEQTSRQFYGPVFYSFPAGAQLQVRATAFSGTANPSDCGAYVVE
jgi:hypothetical protein